MKRFSKKISTSKKVTMLGMALALSLMGVWAGRTTSFFTDRDVKANAFSTGNLEVQLREPEWDPDKDGDGKKLFPGCTLYKNPTVNNAADNNKGTESCYVRMRVEILNQAGTEITDSAALNLIYKTIYYDKTFSGGFSVKGGTSDGLIQNRQPGYCLAELAAYPMVNPQWEKDTLRSTGSCLIFNYLGAAGDGILKEGEESTLFTTIVIPTDWDNCKLEMLKGFQLSITVQAVQAQGFSGMEEAWCAMDQLSGGNNDKNL